MYAECATPLLFQFADDVSLENAFFIFCNKHIVMVIRYLRISIERMVKIISINL